MAKHKRKPPSKADDDPAPDTFRRFADLARRLVRVPRAEVTGKGKVKDKPERADARPGAAPS